MQRMTNIPVNGREHLVSEIKRFLEEYRRKYPDSKPGMSNFVKWRATKPPELMDEYGNGYNMVWPSVIVQAELSLLTPRVFSSPLAAAAKLGSKE